MEHRYRTNLKKVFLSDLELVKLNENISKSNCLSFSEYARRTLLDPGMNFITIDTNSYQDLIFELKRIGNNINQIARSINYSNLITEVELNELRKGIEELIVEVEKDYSVRVLGTEFNLRAYSGFPVVTTLVEGCVQVRGVGNTVSLAPGQQALEVSGTRNIKVLDVDVAPYVAWHEGKFYFVHAPLNSIMEELSRWYDVQVIFENPAVMDECFTIEMQRFDDFNKVLRLIERTGMVTISVDGHTVTVK